jgi:hypothetical protein
MGALEPVGTARVLQANFDAFKFPTSELVQFRALVTPCIPHCRPVTCHITGHRPGPDTFPSYGRKRRRRETEKEGGVDKEMPEEDDEAVVVASAMHIVDNFPFQGKESTLADAADVAAAAAAACSLGNRFPVSVAWIALLACQAVLLVAFVAVCSRRHRQWHNSDGDCQCRTESASCVPDSPSSPSLYTFANSSGTTQWACPRTMTKSENL